VNDLFEQVHHAKEPVHELRSLALRLSSQGYDQAALVEKFLTVTDFGGAGDTLLT
jgi:hypothetical protein